MRAAAKGFARAMALLVTVGVFTACESLLEVELPGDITEEGVQEVGMLATVALSGIGQFECAFAGFTAANGEAYADTWHRTGGVWSGVTEYDPQPNTSLCRESAYGSGWYMALQMGRKMLEDSHAGILAASAAEVANRAQLIPKVEIYLGLTYTLLGEHFCEMAINGGVAQTPADILATAESWFTKALASIGSDFSWAATSSADELAYAGRARARWAQGNRAGALTDAAMVPTDYLAYATREAASEPQRWNVIYDYHAVTGIATIPDRLIAPGSYTVGAYSIATGDTIPFTGFRNLTINAQGQSVINGLAVVNDGVADHRVPVRQRSSATFGGFLAESYEQYKYLGPGDDQVMVSGAEAQLMFAEDEWAKGQLAAAVTRINTMRANSAGGALPAYTVAAPTSQEVKDLILEERRREFFLQGRWWSEKLRNSLWFPLGKGVLSVVNYPYLSGTCMYMPQSEYDANPNVTYP
jgi:hypothetical protein